MAFVRLMCKAVKIEKLKKELEDKKQKSFEASQGKETQYTLKQKYRHFWIDLKNRIGKWFRRKCTFPKKSCMYRTVYKAKRDGTCENFTLKSIIGFISGFFLTYIFFMFFVFILNFKLSTATIMCSFFGSILTIGLAFSYKVRCVVFLLLPQFFSKRGRQALMAYAFILAITGPAKNTLHNMGILSESLACGQEQLKAAVRQIIDVVKKPFYAIRDAIKAVVKTVKEIVKKIKEVLLTIKRIIMAILKVIKAAFQFLGKILNICNKELGTPFERCTRVFENAITDCHAKLGPLFSWLCSITYLVQAVCYIVKIFDFICTIIDFISDSVIGVVVRKVKVFVRHIRTMFYVRIKFSHSFHFETNQSKSMSEITTGIVTEIRHRTENILAVFDFMSCATSLFFLFIILRVLHYRYKFLTSERFDNRFITRYFRDIDMRRAQQEKETVLPLNHRERLLYITVTSIRLVKSEKVKLSKAAVVLGMTTLKLSTHMMADYALYWVLTVIRYHARFQSTVQAPNVVGLHIEGQGFIANLLKSIVKAFQPLGIKLEIDTVPCLPDPIPPDYDRYIQIASLLILCWILTIFEPYGLRLRHTVMCYYHPTRARQRAVWLYNHIMRSRSSFLKFARRQLRRKVTGAKGITKITFKEYLKANINFKWFRLCLGSDKQDACLLCGEVFRESDLVKPIRCIKPGCPGIYCEQCYADLQNLCTVCMEPIQYGDLSDISEEKDSSADEATPEKKKNIKRCTISKCLKRKHDEDSDDEEDGRLLTRPGDLQDSENSDSDYNSEASTDNSYSYQNKKDFTSEPQDASTPKFSDLEKQRIPNYASWYGSTKQGDSEIEPDSDDDRGDFENILNNVKPNIEDFGKQGTNLSFVQDGSEIKPHSDDSRADLKKREKDTVEQDANLSSTSHSSLLSELIDKEHVSQTANLNFGEGSKDTFNIFQGNKLPYTGTTKRRQKCYKCKGDNNSWQTEEKLISLENPFKAFHENKQKVNKLGMPEKHTKMSDKPYRYITQKQQKGSEIESQRIKNKRNQQYDEKSVSPEQSILSEQSTNLLKWPYESDSNNQQTYNKYNTPYRDTKTVRQSKLIESFETPFRNINKQQEHVPLTDLSYRPYLSETTDESKLFKEIEPSVTSETETTFIESPKKRTALLSGTSSSLDSEIKKCQECGMFQDISIPPLNLNFDSSLSSDFIICTSPLTVTDRFRKNVQYEIIQETPCTSPYTTRSNTSATLSCSPRSPINVNYQIYVPRYDTFLDCTDLVSITTGQKRKYDSTGQENNTAKKISEYKHNQRQRRIEDVAKHKKRLQENRHSNIALNENSENQFNVCFTSNVESTVTKQISSCIQEKDKIKKVHANKTESTQSNTDAYKLKVKDYYKVINRKQSTDNPIVTKDQNKLVKFFKRIFQKARNETELSKSPKSKFLLGECDKRLVILSPKLTEGVSSPHGNNSGTIASTSTSGDEFLNQSNTGTSTRSSASSLMGSTESHIRGGAESKLKKSEQSVTTSGTSEITTSEITPSDVFTTTATDVNQNDDNAVSSDSEISEIDIFFGRKSSAKYRKRKLGNSRESRTSDSTIQNRKLKPSIDKDSQSPNFKIERSSSTSKTKTDGTQVNINTIQNNSIISAEESTLRYSRQPAERDQDPFLQEVKQQIRRLPSPSEAENRFADNTNINKIMNDPYTSSEISPGYIENVRGRCCTCPVKSQKNTENKNKNYSISNQNPNTNTNRAMCVCYPSSEVNQGYIENVRGRSCTCPVKPHPNFNMETLRETYAYPDPSPSPRPSPCYVNEATRERRPIVNSLPEFFNTPRDSSEENRRYSPAATFSRSTETSAKLVHEYSGPCRLPPTAVYCNCPPRAPKIDEIREQLLEYSSGEPNNKSATNQYRDSYCTCNSFEIASADLSPRTAMDEDEVSHCSGCSGRSQFPDLVYQNTDEFFELVNELGDTLSQRNRERVQKTMREFEISSSQNKNLEKPIIFESDSEDRSERQYSNFQATCNHCLKKKHIHQPPSTKFTRVETRRKSLTKCPVHSQRCGYVEKVVHHMDRNVDNEVENEPKFNKQGSNGHWELNARTGEWYKVYDDDYYDYENNYNNAFPPTQPPLKQICMCERSPRRYYSRNSPERQMGSYEYPPPRSGKCNNCGFSRDAGY